MVQISSVDGSDVQLGKRESNPCMQVAMQVLPSDRSGPGSVLAGVSLWMPLSTWHMVSSKSGISSSLESPASWEFQLHQLCIFKAIGVSAN